MSGRTGTYRPPFWMTVLLAVMMVIILVQAGQAQPLYTRAAWEANLPFGAHFVRGRVTIVDETTLQVDNFYYDGTGPPAVYFYLGETNDNEAFANGLQLEPQLDQPYNDASLTLNLPEGETLDGYTAISVWCVEFAISFSSASFIEPATYYDRMAWVADIPLGFHSVEGQATIINDHIIHVEHFTYDGTAPLVYFYLGATNSDEDFLNGLQVPPLLDRPYDDESLVLLLPNDETLDGYGAISVWCAEFSVNFSSASFVEPVVAVGDGPAGNSGFTLHDNTPNPFNPMTVIGFDLPEPGPVEVTVFSLDGRRIKTLIRGEYPEGSHEIVWQGRDDQGRNVPSGTYLCRLESGAHVETRPMMLIR